MPTPPDLPIRKYGDMVNHRLLKAVIAGKTRVSARAWS
jgi:exoribonuclease II